MFSRFKVFIVKSNPYHHNNPDWYKKLSEKDIISLNENDYFLLKNHFNLWERINEVLSEDTGYMGGPTLGEDTWIKNHNELLRIKLILEALLKDYDLTSKKELSLLSSIYNLVNKAIENGYWLVFDF